MPSHWGSVEHHVVTQSSPTGTPVPARGRLRGGGALHLAPPAPSRLHGARRRGHLRVARRGRDVGGRVLGEPQHRVHAPPAGAVRRRRQRLRDLGAVERPVAGADLRARARASAASTSTTLDGCDYFAVRERAASIISHVRAGVGPALIHATVTRPYSHSAADTQSEVPIDRGARRRARPRPDHARCSTELIARGVLTAEEAEARADGGHRARRRRGRRALAARRPDPGVGHATTSSRFRRSPKPDEPSPRAARSWRSAKRSSGRCTSRWRDDERIRVFGEDVADAREAVLANVEGKGGVFGTTHGLQRAFGIARCYNTPLAEANIIGRAVGQALRGLRPAPEIQFFDYIWPAMQQLKSEAATIRWRSNGAWTVPDGRAGADRRLPHRRLDLAQPERRVDLRPHPRPAHRVPVARARRGRVCCAPRSAARTRCSSSSTSTCSASRTRAIRIPPRGLRAPVRARRHPATGPRPHDRDVGRDRREVAASGAAAAGGARHARSR